MTEMVNKQLASTLSVVESDIFRTKNVEQSLRESSYQDIVSGFGAADGGVFVVDEKGTVIADSKQVMLGQDVSTSDWYIKARESLSSEFEALYGQAEIYAHSVVVDSKLVISYLSKETLKETLVTPLYVIGVVGVAFLVVVGLLMYFLITRLLIDPIESLEEQVKGLKDGQKIDLKPLKRCPEIAASARWFNELAQKHKPAHAQASEPIPEPTPPKASTYVKESVADESALQKRMFKDILREAFEPNKQAVIEKQLKFALKVENDAPEILITESQDLKSQVGALLHKAINEAQAGSQMEVSVLLEEGYKSKDETPTILNFEVVCDGQKESYFIEAKRD